MRRGNIGVVVRDDKVIAIIAVADLEKDVSVAKVVKFVGPNFSIGYGDHVEIDVLGPELVQQLGRQRRLHIPWKSGKQPNF